MNVIVTFEQLLQIIGQQQVELVMLHVQVAQLETQAAASNGKVKEPVSDGDHSPQRS